MSSQHIRGQRQVVALLVRDHALPSAAYSREPALPASTGVLDPGGVYIDARREQRPEERHLRVIGRVLINRSRRRIEEARLRRTGRLSLPRAQLQHLQQARVLRPQPRQFRGHTAGTSVTPTPYATQRHVAHAEVPSGSRATHGALFRALAARPWVACRGMTHPGVWWTPPALDSMRHQLVSARRSSTPTRLKVGVDERLSCSADDRRPASRKRSPWDLVGPPELSHLSAKPRQLRLLVAGNPGAAPASTSVCLTQIREPTWARRGAGEPLGRSPGGRRGFPSAAEDHPHGQLLGPITVLARSTRIRTRIPYCKVLPDALPHYAPARVPAVPKPRPSACDMAV